MSCIILPFRVDSCSVGHCECRVLSMVRSHVQVSLKLQAVLSETSPNMILRRNIDASGVQPCRHTHMYCDSMDTCHT